MTLRGTRDEGILLITMYQVSQLKGTYTTPGTAYAKQLKMMIEEGDMSMDPQTRILIDVKALVTQKMTEGFRPIIMMDANGDWTEKGSKTFQAFILDFYLIDPLHAKYGLQLQATYSRGYRRLDYILIHALIAPAIKRIGTLGMHKGFKFSNHVFLYMEWCMFL